MKALKQKIITGLVFGLITALVFGACAEDEPEIPTPVPTEPTTSATAVVEEVIPTVAPTEVPATPTTVVVEETLESTPTEVPVTLTNEQALLDIWDSQMTVINNREWERLNEHCYPGYEEIDNRTAEEVGAQFAEFVNTFWNMTLEEVKFTNPNPIVMYGNQAFIEYEVERVNGRAPFHEAAQYSLHDDGNWYDDCALGGWKSLRLQPAAAEISKAEIAAESSGETVGNSN